MEKQIRAAEGRIRWLDIAKGYGIWLVVAGHCLHIERLPFRFIFTFHMPLFFLLSGYVSSGRQPFGRFVAKRARSLLLPFLGYFLLGLAVTLLIPQWRASLDLKGIVDDLYYANPNHVHNSSIWFLVCLFWVCLLFRLIAAGPVWLMGAAGAGAWALGAWLGRANQLKQMARLPLEWDVVPMAFAFFAVGYLLRRYRILERIIADSRIRMGILTAGGLLTVLAACYFNGYVNLRGLCFKNPVLYLAGGLGGSGMIIGLGMLTSACCKKAADAAAWYGRHSLHILGWQSLLIRLYILLCGQFAGVKLKLYYFSFPHDLFCTVLVGAVICPLLCVLWDRIRRDGFFRKNYSGKDKKARAKLSTVLRQERRKRFP